ncbi:MAG: threonylcarbamoyl-AMP synthase [Candidatus Magnetominusculus sp. LBB02]|nr:threonylcarbamoyl-AMP synthase [Candidatus Magnetominusculus sp. LBB02]
MPTVLKLSETPEPIIYETALQYLLAGKIIAYPTETFYGLGAAFDNTDGLKRLWEIKQRPSGKPFPLIAADVTQIGVLVEAAIEPEAMALIALYWPGPLTILFNARAGLSALITSKEGKVAVRIPGGYAALSLVRHIQFPITSTSANISNAPPASDAQGVIEYFGSSIDLIIDGGRTKGGMASTIVDVSGGQITVIREGAVDLSNRPAPPGPYTSTRQGL